MSAEYAVWLQGISVETLKTKIEALLATDAIPRPRRGRKYRGKKYDLRQLILDMRVTPEGTTLTSKSGCILRLNMVLQDVQMKLSKPWV